jgi:16S rRNA (guanine(966)-N(2))-methyltransferase RsmD
MRITGGSLGGRIVEMPPGIIRPAMDRMRESVFGVLANAKGGSGLEGASFLDLFSGSGIIALEAASRGAAHVEAVEADSLKRKILLSNVKLALSLEPSVRIDCHFMAVELFIKRAGSKSAFDYIFCDPPFPYKFKRDILQSIANSALAAENSLILIHHPREEDVAPIAGLKLVDSRRYGRSKVDFFTK